MSQAELEIVISPQGKVQIEVKGVQGSGCTDLTRSIEEALGEVDKRTFKAEYYVNSTGTVNNTGNNGIQHQQY